MGYPTEIPNSIPARGEPPVQGAFARLLERVLALLRRRPRRRLDAPERYGAGVDPSRPPLTSADAQRLDFAQLERRLGPFPAPRVSGASRDPGDSRAGPVTRAGR
jgi:hypothetical protein